MNTAPMVDWTPEPGVVALPPHQWSVAPLRTMWSAGAGSMTGVTVTSGHFDPRTYKQGYVNFAGPGYAGLPNPFAPGRSFAVRSGAHYGMRNPCTQPYGAAAFGPQPGRGPSIGCILTAGLLGLFLIWPK